MLAKNNLKCQSGDKYIISERSGTWSASQQVLILFSGLLTIKYWILHKYRLFPIFAGNLCPPSLVSRYQDDIANPIPALSEFRWDAPGQSQSLELLSISSETLSLSLTVFLFKSRREQCGAPIVVISTGRVTTIIVNQSWGNYWVTITVSLQPVSKSSRNVGWF